MGFPLWISSFVIIVLISSYEQIFFVGGARDVAEAAAVCGGFAATAVVCDGGFAAAVGDDFTEAAAVVRGVAEAAVGDDFAEAAVVRGVAEAAAVCGGFAETAAVCCGLAAPVTAERGG